MCFVSLFVMSVCAFSVSVCRWLCVYTCVIVVRLVCLFVMSACVFSVSVVYGCAFVVVSVVRLVRSFVFNVFVFSVSVCVWLSLSFCL